MDVPRREEKQIARLRQAVDAPADRVLEPPLEKAQGVILVKMAGEDLDDPAEVIGLQSQVRVIPHCAHTLFHGSVHLPCLAGI